MANTILDAIALARRLARQTGDTAVVSRYRGDWIVSTLDDEDLDDADHVFVEPDGSLTADRCRHIWPVVSEGGSARH